MLVESAYGKSKIRLVHVSRRGSRHALRDLTVGIRFEGDYDASYTAGDNSDVLPTDTMKNTVYALAARYGITDIETFALHLAGHFIERNGKLRRVRVDVADHAWRHLAVRGREHGQSFERQGQGVRTATVQLSHDRTSIGAGLSDLVILKSAHSAFTGFPRDELTTLAETTDRLLATSLTARWRYRAVDTDFDAQFSVVREALLTTFAEHDSQSVQHTLYAMGQAVLDAVDEVTAIRLVMPNRHHLPFDVKRFGIEDRGEVFVPTREPYGLIEATLRRDREAR
jgi:urate oxidase